MSLLHLQTALARLYTDSAYRERFFRDRASGRHALTLTDQEQQHLLALDRRQVERYARALRSKRFGAVREALPAAAHWMGARFAPAFALYGDEQPSVPERTADAMAFAAFLLQREAHDAFLANVLRCERLRLQILYEPMILGGDVELTRASRPQLTRHARIQSFDFDMARWYPMAMKGQPLTPAPGPSVILLGKVRDEFVVKLKRVNQPTAQLLERCDGKRSVNQIAFEIAHAISLDVTCHDRFVDECMTVLRALRASGLILVRPSAAGEV